MAISGFIFIVWISVIPRKILTNDSILWRKVIAHLSLMYKECGIYIVSSNSGRKKIYLYIQMFNESNML